ncbi:MAG: hypothetical protein AAB600_02990 [Patescibacteria group bacterium]
MSREISNEVNSYPEINRVQCVGVQLVIVGIGTNRFLDDVSTPKIWTVKELKSKPQTGRQKGQISLPTETRKVGENNLSNILGALAEFCSDDQLPYLKEHLFLLPDSYSYHKGVLLSNNNPGDLAILVYDGYMDIQFAPLNKDEVEPKGWIGMGELERLKNIRDVAQQFIELDKTEDLIIKAINSFRNLPQQRIPVFPPDFSSIERFYIEREKLRNVL